MRIFSSLTRKDVRQLSAMCLPKHYATGDSIIEEGSTGLGLFVLVTGRVEVFKELDRRRISLAVLTDGDVLGEMALLDDQPRSASAEALAATDCLLLSRDRFRVLLKRRPKIAWPMVPALALRIRDLQERLLAAEERARGGPRAADGAGTDEPTAPSHEAPPPAAPQPADDSERPAAAASSNGNADLDGSVHLLRAPYALMMTGTDSLDESARLIEIFLRSLDESAGLSSGRPLAEVVRALPASILNAGVSSWNEGLKVPSKILAGFRRRLRPEAGDGS